VGTLLPRASLGALPRWLQPVPSYYCQPWMPPFKLVQMRSGPVATCDDMVSDATAVPAAVRVLVR
jgi:hypothetical protein